jgi:hypothetical protein
LVALLSIREDKTCSSRWTASSDTDSGMGIIPES